MKHRMQLQDRPFRMIKSGRKTVELRLYDEKRRRISVGDEIEFVSALGGEAPLCCCVLALHRFDSFEELYRSLPLLACGYEERELAAASFRDMEAYYSKEEQEQYGVVGIELRLLGGA